MKQFLKLISLVSLLGFLSACKQQSNHMVEPIRPIPVKGLNSKTGEASIKYTVSLDLSEFASELDKAFMLKVRLEEIGIRSIIKGEDDRSREALVDSFLIEGCREGQARLKWIKSINVRAKKTGDTGAGSIIATYINDGSHDDCGFFFDVDNTLDITAFAPKADLILEIKGESSDQDFVELGGYASVSVGVF